ncbi:Acidic phosphoprotein precursor PCEMA1, putative [Plasmodium berghei]|uniref:Acidic phosphoprotein PCEMA1, putative n=1 Tax=Plasmodium berghei TaxID=5821 RepID=A0A1D3LU40_PLABE|nr:Acidic phosphoprotein precursor PCEMA1, putative [Plasmodium berghei]SCN22400.1 Acidic phosphoprotein precursor PCEMA1, putative [Plasmodium berghei]
MQHPNKHVITLQEIYEKNKHILCTDPEETVEAGEVMKEAVSQLVYHATSKDNYELYGYNEIINELWDPYNVVFINKGSAKIVRVYNPNLVMIQHRYKNFFESDHKYFYALAANFEVLKKKTVLVMASTDINGYNPSKEKYKNEIVNSENLFKTDIDSEDDIRKGKLKKTFVNIAGYLIEKKDSNSDIIYVESVGFHVTSPLKRLIRKTLC